MSITPRQGPPRQFDLPTTISLYLGGFYISFGLLFMLMGGIFFWILGGMGDWQSITHPVKDHWQQTEGAVNSVGVTNASQNDQQVYSYSFRYAVEGSSYVGKAYTTGRAYASSDKVEVRYDPENPVYAVMDDTRRGTFSVWIIPFVLIFPLAGLVFFLIGFFRNKKGFDLLKNGRFTRATPVGKTATTTQINKQTVYKYRFSFQVASKEFEAICKTHICGPLEDEETEKVLYDPLNPDHNVVYDALSNAPAFDQFGKMIPNSWLKAWPLLLILAFLIVNYVGATFWGLI